MRLGRGALARAASISCRRGPATSLSSWALRGGDRTIGHLVAGRGVVARFLGGGTPFGEPHETVEIAAGGVELGLGLGELVLGPPQVFGTAARKQQPELGVGGLDLGPCLGELVPGIDSLETATRSPSPRCPLLERRLEESSTDLGRETDLGGLDVA